MTVEPSVQRPSAFAIKHEEPIAPQPEADLVVDADWRGVRHDHPYEPIGDAVDAEMNDARRTQRLDNLDTPAAVALRQ